MLYRNFMEHRGNVVFKWTHYLTVYERFFGRFRNTSPTVLEIGVFNGGSLQLWRQYFGPLATIVGIDIEPACAQFDCPQHRVRVGDQKDIRFLGGVIKEFGRPDIVIDDGSHTMEDIHASFSFLYPLLNNNGVYVVEDTHTSYWPDYGGGLGKPGTFMETAKSLVDRLNAYHYDDGKQVDDFTRSTFSVSFFDSMVVFEKMRRGAPEALSRGQDAPDGP